ncbi:hypothetical protein V492_04055, partial [Pseudogymnoascus sp. VKM F-4246]
GHDEQPIAVIDIIARRGRDDGRRGGLGGLLQGRIPPGAGGREVQGWQVHGGAQAGVGPLLDGVALQGRRDGQARRAQGRAVGGALHGDGHRRDQAAQQDRGREPGAPRAQARRQPARLVRAQGPQRHARLHGVRGARGEPAGADQALEPPRHPDAAGQADHEAGAAGTGLPAPRVRHHPHGPEARERADRDWRRGAHRQDLCQPGRGQEGGEEG